MNPIAQGLALGYSGQQLLSFITRIFPNIVPKITRAQKAGHSIDSILSFLQQSMDAETGNKGQTAQKNYAKNRERSDDISKTLAKTAIAGLGGYAARNALSGLIGQGTPQQQQQPPPIAPQPQNPTNQAPAPVIGGGGQPAGNPIQTAPGQAPLSPVPPSPNLANVVQLMGSSPIGQRIQSMLKNNPPQVVAQAIKGMNKKEIEEIEKQASAPIEQVVEEFAKTLVQSNPQEQPQQEQLQQPIQQGQPQLPIEQQPIEPILNQQQPVENQLDLESMGLNAPKEEVKIKKTAITPSGDFGEVESDNGKISKINVDGKTKTFNNDKLIESPISEKDAGDLYDEMMSKIPEEDRSSQIFWAGYDEKANKFSFIPHGGALYTYEKISPEWVEKLKHGMFEAKTTGEKTEGKWIAGGKSRGAGLFKLIQDLQKEYGGKGKEYAEKFETIFDAIKPARDMSRAKVKAASEIERAKKKEATKKAKEDEKARKKPKK